jgi:hypothetical protein
VTLTAILSQSFLHFFIVDCVVCSMFSELFAGSNKLVCNLLLLNYHPRSMNGDRCTMAARKSPILWLYGVTCSSSMVRSF